MSVGWLARINSQCL